MHNIRKIMQIMWFLFALEAWLWRVANIITLANIFIHYYIPTYLGKEATSTHYNFHSCFHLFCPIFKYPSKRCLLFPAYWKWYQTDYVAPVRQSIIQNWYYKRIYQPYWMVSKKSFTSSIKRPVDLIVNSNHNF